MTTAFEKHTLLYYDTSTGSILQYDMLFKTVAESDYSSLVVDLLVLQYCSLMFLFGKNGIESEVYW